MTAAGTLGSKGYEIANGNVVGLSQTGGGRDRNGAKLVVRCALGWRPLSGVSALKFEIENAIGLII